MSKPVARFRIGFVTASVWENDKFYNVTLTRSYKDGNEYHDTDSLGAGDLLNAAKVLQRAEAWIAEQ